MSERNIERDSKVTWLDLTYDENGDNLLAAGEVLSKDAFTPTDRDGVSAPVTGFQVMFDSVTGMAFTLEAGADDAHSEVVDALELVEGDL